VVGVCFRWDCRCVGIISLWVWGHFSVSRAILRVSVSISTAKIICSLIYSRVLRIGIAVIVQAGLKHVESKTQAFCALLLMLLLLMYFSMMGDNTYALECLSDFLAMWIGDMCLNGVCKLWCVGTGSVVGRTFRTYWKSKNQEHNNVN
jgi:hypothetical protein